MQLFKTRPKNESRQSMMLIKSPNRFSKTAYPTFQSEILAWEFVTRSCLKPPNPCSNHAIHVLFEHGFYFKSLNWALICMRDVTRESVVAVTDHFADAFVRENVARVYMTL